MTLVLGQAVWVFVRLWKDLSDSQDQEHSLPAVMVSGRDWLWLGSALLAYQLFWPVCSEREGSNLDKGIVNTCYIESRGMVFFSFSISEMAW